MTDKGNKVLYFTELRSKVGLVNVVISTLNKKINFNIKTKILV